MTTLYYLSGNRKGAKYGVLDTEDGVEDYMTISELLTAESHGYKIYGIFRNKGYLYCFGMTPVTVSLLNKKPPFPVAVRLAKGLGLMQTLYLGHRIRKGILEFVFFNDGGMSGICVLSSTDITNGVEIDFSSIDSHRVDVLKRRLKDSGDFVL